MLRGLVKNYLNDFFLYFFSCFWYFDQEFFGGVIKYILFGFFAIKIYAFMVVDSLVMLA